MKKSAISVFGWIMLAAVVIVCLPAILEIIGVILTIALQAVFAGIFAYAIVMLGYGFCGAIADLATEGATDEPTWSFA